MHGILLLLLTLIAKEDDRPVYANYHLNLDRYNNATPAIIDRLNSEALVCLDEIYAWINARVSSSSVNTFLNEIMLQSRKRKIDICGTLQLTRTLDVVFREMTDTLINAERKPEGFAYTVIDVQKNKVVRKFMISNELAKKIYPYYDTYEKVQSLNRRMMAYLETDQDELNRIVDEIVLKLITMNGAKRQSKEFIEDWLLRNNYPPKLKGFVSNRLLLHVGGG